MFLQSFFANHPLLITSGAFVLIADIRQGRDLAYEIHSFRMQTGGQKGEDPVTELVGLPRNVSSYC